MKTHDQTLLVKISTEQKKALEKLAEAAEISISDAVRAFLPNEQQAKRLIENALQQGGKLTVFNLGYRGN